MYRWDTITGEHLNPFVIGSAAAQPTLMSYHPGHYRLYFGYADGRITQIDLASDPEETLVTTLASAVGGLGDAGNFLVAQDDSGSWETHYYFAADGTLTSSDEYMSYSRAFGWNDIRAKTFPPQVID